MVLWNGLFVFVSSLWVVTSMEGYYQPPRGSLVWGYFTPPLVHREPLHSHQSPMDAMVDLTNNLGIAILQDNTFSRGNFAFSPYGVASVLVVLYEGARGESARQIHRAVGFPSDKDIIRVGFRDIHRHLRSYFSHEGYLSGISLNKETSSLKPEYKRVLRFYGYDIDLDETQGDEGSDVGSEKPSTAPTTEGERNTTTVSTTPPPPPNTSTPNSTTSQDKDIEKPEAGDLVTENTTAVTNTIKDMNTTTVSTETKEIDTTVPPTEVVTEADQNTGEPTTTNDGVKTTQKPQTAGDESPVENTKPTESVTEPEEATEIDATTDTSPSGDAKPENSATEQQVETTVAPQDTNEHTTVTTDADTITTTTLKPDSATTEEVIKATTILNLHTESETNEIPNATEPVKSQTELQTPSNVSNGDTERENDKTGKEIPPTGVENSSENHKQGGEVPDVSNGQPPQMSTPTTLVTEAVTVAETTLRETETTEGVKTEEFTNSPLDNGMLIPQSDLLPQTTAGENSTEPPPTTTGVFREEPTHKTVERSTDSHQQNTNSLPGTGKNMTQMSAKILTPEQKKRIRNIINTRVPLWLGDFIKPTKPRKVRTITDYLKSPRSPDLSLQLQNGMYDTHVSRNADLYKSLPRLLFLVDGAIDTPVPMMTYTNIFPYAYIPRLHAKALEFPLDDIRYKLLILLPVERRGLRQLIYDMLDYPLSNVLTAMKPARVKAKIPTFMVEGFVILTSSLQKLGIWDVFDPRKANLSAMSMDPELYVRNVEQSVTVVIRNYVEILDIQTRTMAARYMEYEFEATHPFLYFVLDTSTNVALMAGQILDPLNSRIY